MFLKKAMIAAIVSGQVMLMSGCSDSDEKSEAVTTKVSTVSDPHAGLNLRLAENQGKVLQSISEGSYTYAEVEQNDRVFWIAGSSIPLAPGEIVTWEQAQEMSDVHSKALNRTFDSIYFVSNPATNRAHTTINLNQSSAATSDSVNNSGQIISTQNAAGYSYLQVQTAQGESWIAAPLNEFKPGQYVQWSGASLMRNFTSKSLNRTFDAIIFAGAVKVVGEGEVPQSSSSVQNQGKVISVENAGGYSYVEVETSNGIKWVAAPQTQVAIGNLVEWSGANLMRDFTSSTLNKTFDEILFAAALSKL